MPKRARLGRPHKRIALLRIDYIVFTVGRVTRLLINDMLVIEQEFGRLRREQLIARLITVKIERVRDAFLVRAAYSGKRESAGGRSPLLVNHRLLRIQTSRACVQKSGVVRSRS